MQKNTKHVKCFLCYLALVTVLLVTINPAKATTVDANLPVKSIELLTNQLLEKQVHFTIEKASLAVALKQFSKQSNTQLFYRHNLVVGKNARPIKGKYTIAAALKQLLGTSLRFVVKQNNTIVIIRASTQNVQQAVVGIEVELTKAGIEKIIVVGGLYQGYAEHNPTSGTKIDTPWLQVAQSVSVITKQEIADKGAIRLGQVLDGVSGVNATLGEGARDQFIIRGFDALFDTYRDGMRDDASYQAYRSLANIERVEVVKGAAGALYGRGSAGGLINLITKKADGRSIKDFTISVNSESSIETKADIGGKLSDNVNGRVNLAYRKGERFIENSAYDDFFIAPTLRAELSDNTRLALEFEYFSQNLVPYRGVPSANGLPLDLGNKTNLSGTNDYQDLISVRGGFTLKHHFTDEFAWLNRISYSQIELKQKGTRNSEPINNTMSQTVVNFGFSPQTTLTFQSELTWQTENNALLVGLDSNNLNRENIVAVVKDARIVDLNAPQSGSTTDPGFNPNRNNQVNSIGVYVQDLVTFGQISLLAGLRYDKFSTKQTPFQKDSYTIENEELSPRFGIVYQFNDDVSAYLTSGRSYQLPWGGGYMKNSKAEMMKSDLKEAGIKAYLLDESLMVNAAIFSIERQEPITDEIGAVIDLTDAKHEGFEIEIRGQLSQAWNISAGYSLLDAKDKATWLKPNDVSNQLFSMWSSYQFNSGLSIGGGLHHVGDRYAGNNEAVLLKAYTLLSATAAYHWQQHTVRINLNNITDKRYFIGATSGSSGKNQIGYGAPRQVQLTYNLSL